MNRPDVDAEFLRHMVSEWVFGKHAFDGFGQEYCRIFSEYMLRGCGLQPTGISAVMAIELCGHFVAGQTDLLGIHDDDMISHIHVGSKGRPVFAAQYSGDASRQSS